MRNEIDLDSIKNMIAPFKKIKKVYYADNINMQYSFDSLAALVKDQCGSNLKAGDVFVCDSASGRSRKALIRTETGWLILYFRLDKNKHFKLIKGE